MTVTDFATEPFELTEFLLAFFAAIFSDPNALELIDRDLVTASVMEGGRPR
jgi:hypothetical protein